MVSFKRTVVKLVRKKVIKKTDFLTNFGLFLSIWSG